MSASNNSRRSTIVSLLSWIRPSRRPASGRNATLKPDVKSSGDLRCSGPTKPTLRERTRRRTAPRSGGVCSLSSTKMTPHPRWRNDEEAPVARWRSTLALLETTVKSPSRSGARWPRGSAPRQGPWLRWRGRSSAWQPPPLPASASSLSPATSFGTGAWTWGRQPSRTSWSWHATLTFLILCNY